MQPPDVNPVFFHSRRRDGDWGLCRNRDGGTTVLASLFWGGIPAPGLRTGLPLILYALLSLAWLLLLPPWQGPDEPGHYEYALLFRRLGRPPHLADADETLQAHIIRLLDRHAFWRLTRQARPDPLPTRFADNWFLRRSGSQLGDETSLYYLPLAFLYRRVTNPTWQLYLGRIWSALLGSGVVLAALWGARRAWPDDVPLREGVPVLAALLPMPAFVHTILNNDALANAMAAWFVALSWYLLQPLSPAHRRRLWLPWLGTLFLALVAKRTTLFLAPLALAVPVLIPGSPLRRHGRALLTGLALALLATLVLWQAPDRAAHWQVGTRLRPAPRAVGEGVGGGAAFYLNDDSPTGRLFLVQRLGPERLGPLRGEPLTLSASLRAGLDTPWVCLSLTDGITRSDRCGPVRTDWERWEVTHIVHPLAPHLRAVVGIGSRGELTARGEVFVDNIALRRESRAPNLVTNGNAEQPGTRLAPLLQAFQRWSKLPLSYTRALRDRRTYSWPSLRHLILALAVLFTSFWGNFGWLQYPLPIPVYAFLALITLVALGGLARAVRGRITGRKSRPVLWFNLLALTLALVQNILPAVGTSWLPQGRYLFPALLPILALGLTGTGAWVSQGAARLRLARALLVGAGLLSALSLLTVGMAMR